MATKISEKVAEKVRVALRKNPDGLDAKGLMKATKLDKETLAPVLGYMVNESEEIEVDGKIMTLALEADESEAESEEDEDEDEIVPAKKAKTASKKTAPAKSSGKGQSTGKQKAFSLSYPTLDTLDEDDLTERIETGVKAAEANAKAGQAIVAELIMRSVGKCRKMLRKAQAE
jgi:hypothetical protein